MDFLFGAAGEDRVLGGVGRDVLGGGVGQDFLSGSPENAVRDDFIVKIGQSSSINAGADTILDWTNVDRIVSTVAGSAANYTEHSAATGGIVVTDIESARADAEAFHTTRTHVFFWDAGTDTGYLVSDLNNDNSFETGVVLNRAGSAADFNWTNIID